MTFSTRRTAVVAFAVAIAAGCRTIPQAPVRLQGDPASITALAGSWTGEFWGGRNGLGGSMSFTLHGGTSSLHGDVSMVDPRQQQVGLVNTMDVRAARANPAERLRILLVAVEDDDIGAMLEPYVAPDCNCLVTTTFVGRVAGDLITGRYLSRAGGRLVAQGSWEMKRVGDAH